MDLEGMTIYCDMDGVLADFNGFPNALEQYKEQGFFTKLEPIQENVDSIRELIRNNIKVVVLSTSPHYGADLDKKIWLKKHLPELMTNKMIFARPHYEKIEYLTQEQRNHMSLLIDDYGHNIEQWYSGGGVAAKIDPKPKNELEFKSIKDLLEYIKGL